MTSNRPIAIALAASALYSGVLVAEARADMHYVRVTLITGQQLTVTVDVPDGTPVDQVQIPGLPAPVASIVDLGSAEGTPTPTATAPVGVSVAPTATAAPTTAPSPSPDAPQQAACNTGSAKDQVQHESRGAAKKAAGTAPNT